MKANKPLIRNMIAFAALCGVTLASLPVYSAETVLSAQDQSEAKTAQAIKDAEKKAAAKIKSTLVPQVTIEEMRLETDITKGLKPNSAFQAYENPYMRVRIQEGMFSLVTDIDLTKITSGDTLRTDGQVNSIIHRAVLEAQVANGKIDAGVGRVAFGPDQNADEDLRTIFGNGQDKITNMDQRFLASYQFVVDNATITATVFSGANSGPTSAGNKIVLNDLMDPRLNGSGDISAAVKAAADLGNYMSSLSGVKASVSYAYVRTTGENDRQKIYADLSKTFNIGRVALTALASYAHVIRDNQNDINSYLGYLHAAYLNSKGQVSPWGLYAQFDRTAGENRIEGGIDFSKDVLNNAVNIRWMLGVYSENFDRDHPEVGIGTSLILQNAKPLCLNDLFKSE